jgi:hypothetical protein
LALCTLLSGLSKFAKQERRQHLAPMPERRSHLFRIGIRQMADRRTFFNRIGQSRRFAPQRDSEPFAKSVKDLHYEV